MSVNICYATDENYARHVGISMTSLFINNSEIEKLIVYIIEDHLKNETKNKLLNIGKKYNRELIFISCDKICSGLDVNVNFPKAAFSRLFLTRVQELDKILYLDSDTIINNGIQELYNIDISEYEIAGVQDNAAYYLLKKIGMNKKNRYINSGVLLMNLELLRKNNFEKRVFDFIKKHNGKVNHHDQGIINGVCKNDILILKPKYNMMPEMLYMTVNQSDFLYNVYNYYSQNEINDAINNAVIIHYIEKFTGRPWIAECSHPLKNRYLELLNKSEFDKELVKDGFSKHVKMRKYVFEHFPFIVYVIFEKILDIRRRFL